MFDFDGLIADTETPEFESWSEEFRSYGVDLDIRQWIRCVGSGPKTWDVLDHLQELTGRELDREEVARRRGARFEALIPALTVLPGVESLLDQAAAEGVRTAIASSSTFSWIDLHLRRLGLDDRFDPIVTRDDVSDPKPATDLYVAVCELLGIEPDEAVALEDSANGIKAAKDAGLYCIVVPNRITSNFDLGLADHRVESLAELDLRAICELSARRRSKARS
ncbi:MAG: HAD-IA family hydrolase [Armatimonadetes bacterium]|nr:HAD-IA family hydrolase [Armatimonadota bacterium]